MRWSMVFGFLALVILAMFVMFWLKPYLKERNEISESYGKVLSVIEKEPENKIPGEKEAISLTKKSLAVTDPKDVEKFILIDSSSPEEVVEFLKKVKQEDGEIARYDWVARLDTTREDISGVAVTFKKEGQSRNRLALLIPDEDGRWKMDFAAFARSTTPSWSDLMEGKANSAVVRVYVAPDQYFNGPFKEQDGWRCYGIASPDMPDLFYGYCLAGGPQDKVLAALLTDRKGARATIGIERTEGATDRQFRIKRVLAEDWAIRDTPADEAVK
ncbi:MAG TPA: hypothetical protein VM511_06595 [Luteolibacter sp.]|nr:hypothetical protein [Luteolibacter sp.]